MDLKIEDKMVAPIIEAHVEAAVMEALQRNPEALIREFVKRALTAPKDSYGRETVFSAAVQAMIQKAALDSFTRWLEEYRPKIEAAITKRLRADKGKFVEQLADTMVAGLTTNFKVWCQLKVHND